MSDYDGFTRKSTRTAAIEAAKRIKNTADANKLLSHGVKQEYHVDEANMVKSVITATINNGITDINTERKKSHNDSIVSPSKVQVHDLSKKMTKIVETNPPKRKDMPKRGRGRPPKTQSEKYSFTSNTSMDYDDINDVNARRESYNTSLLKSEPSSPKQLQPLGNGRTTYRESLMKFCKHLGPTARKIALRKLLGQGLNFQARHRLEPSMPPSDFMEVNSPNSSVSLRNATTNQVSQPLMIGYGALRTDATAADYRGKRILVDDGSKSNFNKWDASDIEFLLGKQKYNSLQENASLTGGYGSSENQDFARKNLGYGQFGNWRTINQIGSNYNGKSNLNINNINGIEGILRNGNMNSRVHPSTYVQPPLAPVLPLQNWRLPPPETKNLHVNDGFWREQELQLAMASSSYMQMTDQQPKVWIENSWPQNQRTQFLQPDLYRQPPGAPPLPPYQVLSYQNLFNNGDSQPQDGELMPMPPQIWSQATLFGGVSNQDSFPFGI